MTTRKGIGLLSALELTKEGNILSGCFVDKETTCGSHEFLVGHTLTGDTLRLVLSEERTTGDEQSDCMCHFDIYFTLHNMLKSKY